ncbi:MAG: flagellar hook assembly protein FlgD [Deltaproteobacteria bacterium]|nr:flagellar hook assembly protein FlgD [Nannocystaceae bacterium]
MDPIAPTTTDTGIGTSGVQGDNANLAKALGKDDFLKLLMAQIQFQDPMSPMADHEFVAQLATFSGLEQQMLSNDRLLELQLGQMSNGNAELAGFIGQEVVARGDMIEITSGTAPPIPVQLDGDAETVTLTVRDASGRVVATVDAGKQAAGAHELAWSGKDANGNALPPGPYTVDVAATDASGAEVGGTAVTRGVVTGVSFENGFAELLIGSRRVRPADILSVGTPAPASTQNTGATPAATPTPGA